MIFNLQFLSECFDVNFVEGGLTWRQTRPIHHFSNSRGQINWTNKNSGKIAGSLSSLGYPIVKLTIDSVEYNIPQHRIIYAIFHEDPEPPLIDHVDGVTTNNSISNLRPSNKLSNAKNRYKSKLNKTGITGICKIKARPNLWRASIKIDGVTYTKTTNDFFEACCFRKSGEMKANYSERHGKETKLDHCT